MSNKKGKKLVTHNQECKKKKNLYLSIYIYIYKSRSLNEVLPCQVKSLSKKITCVQFKFKIPYGAIREAHFQTDTRLSLKKKKKKERNPIPYKKKQPFIHGTKETKKKNQNP